MRAPAVVLVVDANVMLAALLGRSALALTVAAENGRNLVTTSRAVEEVRRRLELGLGRPDLVAQLDAMVQRLNVFDERELAAVSLAENALRDAVPSRNGSVRDAHLVALAWATEGDVWSADRDFAGVGVPSWSTANLMRALG